MPRQRRRAPKTNGLISVVVATDFSMGSRAAVRRVSELPLKDGARVVLVHVLPARLLTAQRRASAAVRDNLVNDAQRLERSLARHTANVTVRPLVMSGSPHDRIAAAARTAKAELVVVGRHGQRPLADLFGLGTTADRVLRTSGVPVLVVSGKSGGSYRRPLLAMDIPPGAPIRSAARMARRIVARTARWTALHVPEYPYVSALHVGLASRRELASASQIVTQRAKAIAADVALRLLGDTSISVRVTPGDPQFVIPRAAAAASRDLLVIGTHSRSGLERRLLGSVTDAVLRRVRCDVLVAPAPRRR